MKKGVFYGIVLVLMLTTLSAQEATHVIANSEDWKDVLSTLHYATLQGIGSDFLVSTSHGPLLLNGISTNNDILIVTSEDFPYIFNYEDIVNARGYRSVEEIETDNANLELIEELPEVENFIVVGDDYGYNAVAVIPYAVLKRGWIFFANEQNIQDITAELSSRDVEEVLIYGYVEPGVRTELEEYDPVIINEPDRFDNNIAIVERFLDESEKINPGRPVTQISLTNGEFIEKELMTGRNPTIFTGRDNVPDKIRDYLRTSDFEVGVLIGNDLVGAATNIRRNTGMSVMVKFARGARQQTGGVAAVEGLDLYPIPTPYLALGIHEIRYNTAKNQLEVTYKSDGNVPTYLKGTITVDDGIETIRVGDEDAVFVGPNDYKTVIYPMDLATGQTLSARILTLYGEAPGSLERILEATIEIQKTDVIDACELTEKDIKYLRYNKQTKEFILKIENPHEEICWIDAELREVIIGGDETNLATEGAIEFGPGETKKITFEAELTDEDIEENGEITTIVFSGERETGLVHTLKLELELDVARFGAMTYVAMGVGVILIIIIILWIKKRREEDDDF